MSVDLADALDAHIGVCRLGADSGDDPRFVYLEGLKRPKRSLSSAWYRSARNALYDLGYEYGWRTAGGEPVSRPVFDTPHRWVEPVFTRGEQDGRECYERYICAFTQRALATGSEPESEQNRELGALLPVLQGAVNAD